ncbi:hypothetical protein LCGC14_3099570, partial [marine sediment metagenome]
KRLRAEGIEIVEGAQAQSVAQTDDGIVVTTEGGSHTGSHLLVAVGRKVNIDKLDLDRGNVAHDRAVKVGADLRSASNRRVYAVGDAAGGLQFTHVAGYHAGIVVRAAVLGMSWSKTRGDHIPWVTYCDPELAHVGLTEEQARDEHGGNLEVIRFPYEENDRAIASGETTGLIKLLAVRGRPVGVTIAGAHAGELIGMWAMAIANRQKLTAMANTVLPYPTLSEINKRAAGAYFSPRLFDNPKVRTIVGIIQKYLP